MSDGIGVVSTKGGRTWNWSRALLLFPSACALFVLLFFVDRTKKARTSQREDTITMLAADTSTDESTCACPEMVKLPDCGNVDKPFLGGVDVVEYWNFDDDSSVGVAGSDEWKHKHNGYTFYFSSKENLKLFKSNLFKYEKH